MRLSVALLPSFRATGAPHLCIVIDVLRATTTLTTLIEHGAVGAIVTADLAHAFALKRLDHDALLIGEDEGLPPAGFDLGNSPSDLSRFPVAGRHAICRTSNGTAALQAVAREPVVLLGCLRNATAVSRLAARAARGAGLDLTIVCSGAGGGRSVARDDALVAGFLVESIARETAAWAVPALTIDDTAAAARAQYRAALGEDGQSPTRWRQVLLHTPSGQHLTRLGLAADVAYCAVPDATTVVARAYACGEIVRVARMVDGADATIASDDLAVAGRAPCS